MGLIDLASGKSLWRGLDYYKENKVIRYSKVSDTGFEARVDGSRCEPYNVFIDIEHPRKSKCDCPHAKDRRVVCKHMVALYFNVFPKEAERVLREAQEAEKAYEEYQSDLYDRTIEYINSMSVQEAREALIEILSIAPEWVSDIFTRDYVE